MANFNVHFSASTIFSGSLIIPLMFTELTIPNIIITFGLGVLGGLLPDIDSDNSKSISIIFTLFAILITILFLYKQYCNYSLEELLFFTFIIFSTIRFVIINIFRKFSKHRGMFHSIPSAILSGMLLTTSVNLFFQVEPFISWVYGIILTSTYILHLILDEMYSVDLRNIHIKKSFGTALKFYQKKTLGDKINTTLIYLSIIVLLLFIPDITIFIEDIKTLLKTF